MPDLSPMLTTWVAICVSEALAIHKPFFPSRAAEYGPYLRDFLGLATLMTPAQIEGAQAARRDFATRFNTVLESVDAVACPAGGAPAWPITRELQLATLADFQAA